ncbi:MAG: hypothetical protein V3S29_12785 [bacterium]
MVINDLRSVCAQCRGAGRTAGISDGGISQINAAGVCPQCLGKGFLITELGQDLLNLLRPFILELIDEARPEKPQPPSARSAPPEEDDDGERDA